MIKHMLTPPLAIQTQLLLHQLVKDGYASHKLNNGWFLKCVTFILPQLLTP
jgi:hypothetical protein